MKKWHKMAKIDKLRNIWDDKFEYEYEKCEKIGKFKVTPMKIS